MNTPSIAEISSLLRPGDFLFKHDRGTSTHTVILIGQSISGDARQYRQIVHGAVIGAERQGAYLVEVSGNGLRKSPITMSRNGGVTLNESTSYENGEWEFFRYKTAGDLLVEKCWNSFKRPAKSELFKTFCHDILYIVCRKLGPDSRGDIRYTDDQDGFYRALNESEFRGLINHIPETQREDFYQAVKVLLFRDLVSDVAMSILNANRIADRLPDNYTDGTDETAPEGRYNFLGALISVIGTKIRGRPLSDRNIRDLTDLRLPRSFFCSQFVVYVYNIASIIFFGSETAAPINLNLGSLNPANVYGVLKNNNDWERILISPEAFTSRWSQIQTN